RPERQDLSGPRPRHLGNLLYATPLRDDQEQRPLVRASECAGETAAVEVDGLQHSATFADAYATLVGNVSVPDGVVRIDADPVRRAAAEVGAAARVGEAAARRDIESRQSPGVGLGDDERGVVGRHGHAIRKGEAVRHLSSGSITRDEGDDSGDTIDVGVAAAVDDDLVPRLVGEAAQVGMRHERAVELLAQETTLAPRDDQQAAIRQPVDAEWKTKRSAGDDLAVAVKIDRRDFLSAPVREPETVLVPAG